MNCKITSFFSKYNSLKKQALSPTKLHPSLTVTTSKKSELTTTHSYSKNRETINKLLKGQILINQSHQELKDTEIEALCLGLNFIPTTAPKQDKSIDTTRWIRDINLSAHFYKQRENKEKGWLWKHVPSDFNPEQEWNTDEEMQKRLRQLRTPITTYAKTTPKPILDAISDLRNQKMSHIMKSDKGRNIVIWPIEQYDQEALRQLSDTQTYLELTPNDYTTKINEIHKNCCQISENLLALKHITTREDEAICHRQPEGSYIYFLPKTHKPINNSSKTFAGRPIVATFTSTTFLLDKFLTELTRPLLAHIPGSLIDTNDLLGKLKSRKLPTTAKIITADVSSLYPSIPWANGIEAATNFYNNNIEFLREFAKENGHLHPPSSHLFKKILELVLTNSIIIFKDRRYFHQIKGTAMGCCISVYFANCYMYTLTQHLVHQKPEGIILFERFIDDILLITTHNDEVEIEELFQSITNDDIKYEISKPDNKQAFLDLSIYIDANNRLQTAPYWKPTASGAYLHPASNHPKHTIHSVPYAQLLRLRRNSSTAVEFVKAANRLKKELRNMTYDKKLINSSYKKVLKWADRKKNRDISYQHKLFVSHNNNVNWEHTRNIMNLTYLSIISSYYNTDTPRSIKQANHLRFKGTALITQVGANINSHFSKQIKKPRY